MAKIDDDNDKDKDYEVESGKPTSLDIKYVKKPKEYHGDGNHSKIWVDRLKDLMINRSEAWGDILVEIEEYKEKRTHDGAAEIFCKLAFPEYSDVHMNQLKAYVRAYTTGGLYER